jgi:hypothetical protein
MFCERTKEGAAQATARKFQEETKWSAALTVSVPNKVFGFFVTGLEM